MTKRSVDLGKWWPWEVVTVMAACLLHGLGFGARSLVFFRVKWLQAAMKGTLCVQRLGFGSFQAYLISSPFVFCNVWMQIALQWLHGCVRGAAKRIVMAA